MLFLFSPGSVYSHDYPVLSREFWIYRETAPDLLDGDFSGRRKTPEEETGEKITGILEEAVYVYSGMIYGFSFTYTPPDSRRGVDEVFEVEPAAQIRWGDPALKTAGVRIEGNRIYFRINYSTDESHSNWLRYWDSTSFASSGGTAEGMADTGLEGRMDALNRALKEAVRNFLRPRVFNRPSSASGEFVLAEPPSYVYQAGRYTASVKIRLNIDAVEKYLYY